VRIDQNNCGTWRQTYTYDAYGNRAVTNTTGPYTSPFTQTALCVTSTLLGARVCL